VTVLITGGAGSIGSHMVYALLDAGEHAVVVDNLSTGFDWAIPKGVPLVISDSGDQSHIAALIAEHAIDAIIHFAASLIVPDSLRDLLRYYRNNTVNSRALIETAVESGVRHFIFSLTCAVYGNPGRIPVREDDPTVPVSPTARPNHAARRRGRSWIAVRDPLARQVVIGSPFSPFSPLSPRGLG